MRMLLQVAAGLIVFAWFTLVADVGAPGPWIAVVAFGIVSVVIAQARSRHGFHP